MSFHQLSPSNIAIFEHDDEIWVEVEMMKLVHHPSDSPADLQWSFIKEKYSWPNFKNYDWADQIVERSYWTCIDKRSQELQGGSRRPSRGHRRPFLDLFGCFH